MELFRWPDPSYLPGRGRRNRRSIDGLSVLIEDRRIFDHMQVRIRAASAIACVVLGISLRVGRVMSSQGQRDACGTELNKKLLQATEKEQPVKTQRQQVDSCKEPIDVLSKVIREYFHGGTTPGN